MAVTPESLPPARLSLADLRGAAPRRRREFAVRLVFLAAATVSILISVLIILSLIGRAAGFLVEVDPASLLERGWFPRRDLYGLPTILAGTLVVAGIGMLVAAPLGLGAAIYLSEYAGPTTRRTLKPILEVLAGIPSVVLGYFAITFISPTKKRLGNARLAPRTCSEPMARAVMAAVIVWPVSHGLSWKSDPPEAPAAMATIIVSPMARETPRMRAATMPEIAAGKTTRRLVVRFRAPSP